MDTNPYQVPDSDLEEPAETVVPETVMKKIRNGWIAALISATITLGLVLFAVYSGGIGKPDDLLDAWILSDIVLVIALAYGIYRKSRIASTGMFIYFACTKIFLFIEYQAAGNVLLLLLFAYLYFQAMIGTFQYHRHSSHPRRAHTGPVSG